MNKRGDYKWSIILSLILGLLVLGLSLFFIFNEFFTEEDSDFQVCRQSIQVRALLPDVEVAGVGASFKDDFPLKCKTMVKTIERDDVENDGGREAREIIAGAMAECWALYDKGDSNAFPAKFFKASTCVPCARIHLTEEAKEYMRNPENNVEINIRDSLDEKMRGQEYTYYNFLMNAGDKFSAFNFGNGVPFDLESEDFSVMDADWLWETRTLTNKVDGSTYDARMSSVNISLPEVFDYTKGDLLINYGIVTVDEGSFGRYIPYLFYFQTGQEPSPFDEVKSGFIFNLALLPFAIDPEALALDEASVAQVPFCGSWEGIPA